ncbi:MAG: xanthine dehydrogenase family protein molybdopterin-binding subunit [Blastocatellia bacterium AA13]|nr:MAG: xanthine dehydrogenase family protein molybdopterin-binding subunit [Blastocatellia bacterium AA13]
MADYKWPDAEKRTLIGKRISRLDGPAKASGKAKYCYDYNRQGLLYGKILRSPHAHAKIKSIDTSAAEKMPGVKAVKVIQGPGTEIFWAGDEIVGIAAVDEPTAEDAMRAIKIEYEVLPHHVIDNDPKSTPQDLLKPSGDQTTGEPDKAFGDADVVVEGQYGQPVITHCCLESHGATSEWTDDKSLLVHVSTQNVSGIANQMAGVVKVPAANIHVQQDHIGGGFGSKFSIDRWGNESALLSKMADGKPVKIFLERSSELMVAGARPSSYAKVKIGAKKDGELTAWESESWGTGGIGGGGAPPIPYVFNIPNQKRKNTSIANHIGPSRAWRAPNHPQACLITMSALDDLAAALKMDPLEFYFKNMELTGPRANVYRDEFKIGAELIGWKQHWHQRGDQTEGPIKRGLGLSLHTWGGLGHASDCDLTINPDGSVELKMGTQDLGTGTRTTLAIVVADSLGIPMDAVKISIGDNKYPVSGGSGGSTTIGGVSASSRRASVDALDQLFAKAAPALNAQPGDLESVGGAIRVKSDPGKSLTWAQACGKLGGLPLTVRGKNPGPGNLISQGVGGIQMADVSVDIETGIVKMNRMVAVQDCGLIIDLKTAESQVYGALIMGICSALYEEKIMDQNTGKMLNPNMEFYKLAGIGDIGELMVHMMTGKGYDERGPIGLGEPPTVSPGAAISNAVANAVGVRVPYLPLTPDKVLAALEKKGGANHAGI